MIHMLPKVTFIFGRSQIRKFFTFLEVGSKQSQIFVNLFRWTINDAQILRKELKCSTNLVVVAFGMHHRNDVILIVTVPVQEDLHFLVVIIVMDVKSIIQFVAKINSVI